MHKNVQEVLSATETEYKTHEHAKLPSSIKSPQDFANALGYDLARITKSLFVKCVNGDKYAIVVCSMDKNIDFPVISNMLDCGRVEVAKREELKERIGYPPNGVSPIGVSDYPIFVDEGLLNLETILLGAGKVGVEVEIAPSDLVKITNANALKFAIDK